MIQSLRISLIALVIGLFSPLALAQQAQSGPVEECLSRMARITQATAEFNRQAAVRTVHIVRELNDNNAADQRIIAAGTVGKEAIDRRSHASIDRINTIVDNCVANLRENDAPRAAIIAVIRGGQAARDAIGASAHRSSTVINRAVRHALNF